MKIRPMKILFTASALLLLSHCFGQVFYKSINDAEFEELLNNGIVYIKSGNAHKDAMYETVLEKYWKSTAYQVYDPNADEEKLSENRIALFEAETGSRGPVLGLVPLKVLLYSGSFSMLNTIGHMYMNGFSQMDDTLSTELFLRYTVSALDDIVASINTNEISGGGIGLYKRITKSFAERSKLLKSKTLLIVGETQSYMSNSGLRALDELGLRYEKVTQDEFAQLATDNPGEYSLFCFVDTEPFVFSFFDVESADLLYTNFVTTEETCTRTGILKMAKDWD